MVRGQWANLARMLGSHPLLFFFEGHPGIFNDHIESGPLLFESIVSPSLYWGVRTHTDCRVSTPCWPY